MEQRVWISIVDVPFEDESQWAPLVERLERSHPEMGPIASWDDEKTIVIVLCSDAPDRASAAERGTAVVSEAPRACRLGDRMPSVFRVEPVEDALAA